MGTGSAGNRDYDPGGWRAASAARSSTPAPWRPAVDPPGAPHRPGPAAHTPPVAAPGARDGTMRPRGGYGGWYTGAPGFRFGWDSGAEPVRGFDNEGGFRDAW